MPFRLSLQQLICWCAGVLCDGGAESRNRWEMFLCGGRLSIMDEESRLRSVEDLGIAFAWRACIPEEQELG